MIKKGFLFVALILFPLQLVHAETSENGISVVEESTTAAGSNLASYGNILIKEVTRFDVYSIPNSAGTGTYIYNNVNGTSSAAGSINCKGLARLIEMLTVNAIASGTITASIEIGIGSNTTWYEALAVEFNTAETKMVNIIENVDRIRVGWKKSSLGTATISDIGSYRGNVK